MSQQINFIVFLEKGSDLWYLNEIVRRHSSEVVSVALWFCLYHNRMWITSHWLGVWPDVPTHLVWIIILRNIWQRWKVCSLKSITLESWLGLGVLSCSTYKVKFLIFWLTFWLNWGSDIGRTSTDNSSIYWSRLDKCCLFPGSTKAHSIT